MQSYYLYLHCCQHPFVIVTEKERQQKAVIKGSPTFLPRLPSSFTFLSLLHNHNKKNSKRILDPTSKCKSIHIQVFKYPCIQVFKYESIECMRAFKFAILEFGQLLTYNVKARDPVGSKNLKMYKQKIQEIIGPLPRKHG